MNRTDRLMGILLELQARGELRAVDLAHRFEVSLRTVYRDVQALCETGVPIVATPGKGYRLIEGFASTPPNSTKPRPSVRLLPQKSSQGTAAFRRPGECDGDRSRAGTLPCILLPAIMRVGRSPQRNGFGLLARFEWGARHGRVSMVRGNTPVARTDLLPPALSGGGGLIQPRHDALRQSDRPG